MIYSHKLQFFLFFVKWDSSFFFLMNQIGFKLQAFTSCYYFLPSCITSRAFFGSKLSRGLRYFFWSSFFIEIRICYGPITWAKPTTISFFFLATIRNTVDAFDPKKILGPEKMSFVHWQKKMGVSNVKCQECNTAGWCPSCLTCYLILCWIWSLLSKNIKEWCLSFFVFFLSHYQRMVLI